MSDLARDVFELGATLNRVRGAQMGIRPLPQPFDVTEHAMHTVHEAVLAFDDVLDATHDPARCVQLQERATSMVILWERIARDARDKAKALRPEDLG